MIRSTLLLSLLLPFTVWAEGLWVHHAIEEEFDTIKEYIEEGITNQGLVVAHRSDVGGMLERTGKDLVAKVQKATHSMMEMAANQTGIENPIEPPQQPLSAFSRSEVIEFCSAKLSRKMTDADPANVIFCPIRLQSTLPLSSQNWSISLICSSQRSALPPRKQYCRRLRQC